MIRESDKRIEINETIKNTHLKFFFSLKTLEFRNNCVKGYRVLKMQEERRKKRKWGERRKRKKRTNGRNLELPHTSLQRYLLHQYSNRLLA